MLQVLEISGFKSFARPVRLEFPPGITAIVGPNGSGKSNVVDAIRWCLGEQSMRDLRGTRAEDVIYAGPRRVLGAADVQMTFDAENGELTVGRRLYRSGESEYLLNRSRVRLRDVTVALADLGIDAERHVVVTQGMADGLLSATPAERRSLLEGAAGLSSYRERRDEARAKLSVTATNIATVEVVLAELEPRVKLLRRHARAVEERESVLAVLRERSLLLYSAQRSAAETEIEHVKGTVAALAGERARLAADLAAAEERSERLLAEERAYRHELDAAVAAFHVSQRERDAAGHRLEIVRERIHGLEKARDAAHERDVEIRRELDQLESRRMELAAQGAESERAVAAAEERARSVQNELAGLESVVAEGQRREDVVAASLRAAEARQAQLERSLQLESERRDDAERQADAARSRLGEIEVRRRAICAEIETVQSRIDAGRNQLAALSACREAAAKDLSWLEERAARLGRLQSRLRTRATRAAMRGRELASLIKTLESQVDVEVLGILSVPLGWEDAVSAALSPAPHLAAPDPHFGEWRAGLGADLLWADTVVGGHPSGLSALSGTILVETEADACSLWSRLSSARAYTVGSPPVQVVARDGARVHALGTARLDDDRGSRYLRAGWEARHVADLQARDVERLARVMAAAEECRLQVATGTDAVRRLDVEMAESAAAVRKLEEADRAARRSLASIEGDVQSLAARLEWASSRMVELSHDLDRLDGRLKGERAEVCRVRDEAAGVMRESESDRRRLVELRQILADARGEAARHRARIRSQADATQSVQRDVERLTAERARQEAGRQRDEEALRAARSEEVALHDRAMQLEAVVRDGELTVRQLRDRPTVEDRTGLAESRAALTDVAGRHERSLARLEVAEAALAELDSRLWEEFSLDPGQLPERPALAPTPEEIRRLRSRAAAGADLDESVVVEWRELDERARSLHSHLEDLCGARDQLHAILELADAEMRHRFDSAFAAVNEEFARVFRVMLRGGSAHLERMPDGGVEIRAQLPGRRARSSASFSGGERALVASSLLFGVLTIRPTPFCILDEVDAALDETNVDRYLDVLRDISGRTQTIVVTHNRATMAAASALYGMTMDAEGASSPLSLRLDQYAS